MSLSQSKLERSLLDFYRRPKSIGSVDQAERLWADAYHSYALDVEDVSGDGATNLERAKFLGQLNFRGVRHQQTWAAQMDQAFVTYWTGVVFAVGTPPVGPVCPNVGGNLVFSVETTSVVTLVTPGVLQAQLLPVATRFTRETTARQKAAEFAQAFHAATTTAVFVLISGQDTTPGPSGPLPITNTCTLF